jgi:16S rRNA (adenine1518-N6/adenine1519-N6)-dimethyltransferase
MRFVAKTFLFSYYHRRNTPMQRLGQHFLKNPEILQKIASSCTPQKNGVVIEIGPGHGELTNLLIARGEQEGWRLISIEKDATLALSLKKKEGSFFSLYEGDALKLLPRVVGEIPEHTPYWVVGNIPYYITGKLFRTLGELPQKPEETVVLIQEEVALRASSAPPHMNRLSASLRYWTTPKVLFRVPKGNFNPPPKVESAVLSLKTHKEASNTPYNAYFSAVKMLLPNRSIKSYS